jgi:hypothetical protein
MDKQVREIKFRAWDKRRKKWFNYFHMTSDGKWVVYDSEDGGKSGVWEHDISEDYDLEIMQFTGLKDKTGSDIYEGDIVKSVYREGKLDQIAVVECELPVSWSWGKYGNINMALSYNKDTEIIGNIYENADLLEVK